MTSNDTPDTFLVVLEGKKVLLVRMHQEEKWGLPFFQFYGPPDHFRIEMAFRKFFDDISIKRRLTHLGRDEYGRCIYLCFVEETGKARTGGTTWFATKENLLGHLLTDDTFSIAQLPEFKNRLT